MPSVMSFGAGAAMAMDTEVPNELSYNDHLEYFGPDFKLHISPSNMTNQNTNACLEKIMQRLFESLRMLSCAPGVRMHAVPEDAIPGESGVERRKTLTNASPSASSAWEEEF